MKIEEIKKINEEVGSDAPHWGSWNKLYLFVLLQTAVLVLFFYIFTRFFE
ncbi:MAG: hypothetical protein K9J12_01910 [Melioribacteraceae bacterium]|nr:hypothetical protein [Melioribacteraceae bacterium]MCF8412907.1 hypothetical protein [Melioribacteraceae bacterium]MCF8432061.1 hypothetical protein [Melioribacteraceae bacterium]